MLSRYRAENAVFAFGHGHLQVLYTGPITAVVIIADSVYTVAI